MTTVADTIVQIIREAGVERVYGVPGDSLNGFTDALRRSGGISREHVRHEEAAAFAAAAEAALTGELTVCAGNCGPGNLHLINGLFDANRGRVPVLAIAAQIPGPEIGSTYFQETHPQDLFREAAVYTELVSIPSRSRGSSRSRCARPSNGAVSRWWSSPVRSSSPTASAAGPRPRSATARA